VTILAVGDIAECYGLPAAGSVAARTAKQIALFPFVTPLLVLGDLVYETGSAQEFNDCYDPTYGAFFAKTFPAPGNHEYDTPGAAGYFNYFGARAGPDNRGYYSFDIGTWHIVSLNSNVDMTKGSAQELWLRADLSAHRVKPCTLAYWHHPRFSSGSGHGDDPRSSDIWRVLFEFRADVVLAGHNHIYERFAPQDPDANKNFVNGIRQFVVGTGGVALDIVGTPKPNSEVRASTFGITKFELGDGKFSWEFLPESGTFSDFGQADCVK
jgi:acid phosphatase type 7